MGTNEPFTPDSDVTFNILVQNTGNTPIPRLLVKDTFPEFVSYTAGVGNFDPSHRTLSFETDNLDVNEKREFRIMGRTFPADRLPQGQVLIPQINHVEAIPLDGGPTSQANLQFYIQKQIGAVTPTPTGQIPIPTSTPIPSPTTAQGVPLSTPTPVTRTPSPTSAPNIIEQMVQVVTQRIAGKPTPTPTPSEEKRAVEKQIQVVSPTPITTTKTGIKVFPAAELEKTPATGPEVLALAALFPTGALGWFIRRKAK